MSKSTGEEPPSDGAPGEEEEADLVGQFDEGLFESINGGFDEADEAHGFEEAAEEDAQQLLTIALQGRVHFKYKDLMFVASEDFGEENGTFDDIMKLLGPHVRRLLEERKAWTPGSDVQKQKLANFYPVLLKNTPYGSIYFVIRTGKLGYAKRGKVRASYYPDGEAIVVVYYYDFAADADSAELDEIVGAIGRLPGVYIKPEELKDMSVKTAKQLNDKGDVSFFFQLFMHTLTHDVSGSCLGGGAGVSGLMRAAEMPLLESIFTIVLRDKGIEVDEGAAMHEMFKGGGYFQWYDDVNAAVKAGGKELLDKFERDGLLADILALKIVIMALCSWRPEEMEGAMGLTIIVVLLLLGVLDEDDADEYWRNAINVIPPKGGYRSDSYTLEEHLRPGFEEVEKDAVDSENAEDHVFKMVDSNDLIMQKVKGTTLVKWLESREIENEQGETCKWERYHEYLRIIIMRLDKKDGRMRFWFIVRPVGYMLFAGSYTNPDGSSRDPTQADYDAQAMCTQEIQFLLVIFGVITTKDSDGEIRSPDTIWRNPAFSFITSMFMVHNQKVYRKAGNLLPKSLLAGKNLMHSDYHRMPASTKGRTVRQQQCQKKTGYEGPQKRRWFNILCGDGVEAMVDALPNDIWNRELRFQSFAHHFLTHASHGVQSLRRQCEEVLQTRRASEQSASRARNQSKAQAKREKKRREREEAVREEERKVKERADAAGRKG